MIAKLSNCLGAACLTLALAVVPYSGSAQKPGAQEMPPIDEAAIAYLIDITSGQVLHARNADRRFVPASITKVMTAYVAFELMQEGKLKPDQMVQITPETWRAWNGKGSTMWLDTETSTRVEDLLTGIVTVSANDASVVLAEGVAGSVPEWTAMMNAKARSLGMFGSHFATPNGWPDDGRTFTTARDLAKLAEAVTTRHPKSFRHYFGRAEFPWNGITQINRDPLIGRVEGADGLKTGYTNEAGFGFLGTAKRGDQRLVMVLAGMDRNSSRARLSREFMEWGFAAFDRQSLLKKAQVVGRAKVQNGAEQTVAVRTDRTVRVNVPKGRTRDVTMTIRYNGPLRAPIAKGARVATLEIVVPGMDEARIPLLADADVEQAGVFDRLWNGLVGWVT
ncbi:MAG: D-alanyl-D-alanine carboxypeptidase family protein [Pseudomonadota bacterium]